MRESENITYIRPKRKRRRPLIGLSLFLLFSFALSLYFFINSAFFALKKIEVSGCNTVPQEEIIKLSGVALGTNLFKVDVRNAIAKIEMQPVVKTVTISRKLPHTLVLHITERTPAAVVVGNDGYLAVDIEGKYVKKVDDLLDLNLPVISGITVKKDTSPGADLTTPGLNAALQLIRLMEEPFLKNVTEIQAASPQSLTLKMLQGVEIRFGEPENIEQKLKIIRELLMENGEVINEQTVEYIDLRYNSLPVIKKVKVK